MAITDNIIPPDMAIATTQQHNLQEDMLRTGELRNDLQLLPGDRESNGNRTYLLFDPVADNYFRISQKNYRIIKALSADMPMNEFLEKLKKSGIQSTKAEVFLLIGFLQNNHLMQSSYGRTEQRMRRQRAIKRSMFWNIILSSYLFFRVPLLRPDRFLNKTVEAIKLIFNHWTMLLLLLLTISGYLSVIVNYNRFADAFINSISIQGLIRYSIAVFFIKLIHEFAHAYSAKLAGCRVRRMGVAVVFFIPRFYTDLTDAWRVTDRKKRFLIDGAGIFSELFIGGIAALVWSFSLPGLTQTIAYYIFTVSIINTIFINGNPFIRYDGYYMLMDLMNLDNLHRRGVDCFRNLWHHWLLGLPEPIEPESQQTTRQKVGLILYGICAFIYRFFLYTSIILIVYFQFTKTLGIILLTLEVYLLLIKPLIQEGKLLKMNVKTMDRRRVLLSLSGAAVLLALLFLPLPWKINAPCEIKSRIVQPLYAQNSGFLEAIAVEDGDNVKKGDIIFSQENPFLDWMMKESELEEQASLLQLDQSQAIAERRGERETLLQALAKNRETHKELLRRKEEQITRSIIDGCFSLYDSYLKPGKWLNRGELIGEIYDPDNRYAVAYLTENEIRNLSIGKPVTIHLSHDLEAISGTIEVIRALPASLTPSPLLNAYGGPILTVQTPEGQLLPLEGYFQIDIAIDPQKTPAVGRSGIVSIRRFSSIGGNLLRQIIQTLRRELSF